MSEIKVGEYIRTESGEIGQVERFEIDKNYANPYCIKLKNKDYSAFYEEIPKHSQNIKDLIEVGDYVNGDKVEISRYNELYVSYVYCGGVSFRTTEAYATFIKDMEVEDIESIVTREQFEKMGYKVNE